MSTGRGTAAAPRQRRSRRDDILSQLRTLILEGDLRPGERLVERTLAETLGVSRVPVREALRALEHEGLVEERATRGMVVRRLSDDDIDALFDLREALEGLLCRRLVRHLDAAGLDQLRTLVERSERAAREGALAEAVQANADFHQAMVQLSNSALIAAVTEPVAGQLSWLLTQHSEPEPISADHRRILEALEQRDAPLAAARCLEHLDTSRQAVTRRMGLR